MTEKDPGTPPERKIEPLAPPPGRFDQVFRESRRRRYNRAAATCGVAGVFLAGLFGGLVLGGPRAAVVEAIQQASEFVNPPSPSPSGGPDSSSTVASNVPQHGRKHPRTATVTVPVTAPPDTIGGNVVHGRLVNSKGEPLSELYVYYGVNSERGFVPSDMVTTDDKGEYDIPCTGGPVLITPWQLNVQRGATVDAVYGAHLLDPPVCGQKGRLTTTMTSGAAVEGTVHAPAGCSVTEYRVWLWVKGSRAASVRLGGLTAGGSYRISGLPSGISVFGDQGTLTPVTLTAGETTHQDLELQCPDDTAHPTPTQEPSTPGPTPSETPSSSPSPSDPQPSTSTPTGSGTGAGAGSGGGASPSSSTR